MMKNLLKKVATNAESRLFIIELIDILAPSCLLKYMSCYGSMQV